MWRCDSGVVERIAAMGCGYERGGSWGFDSGGDDLDDKGEREM